MFHKKIYIYIVFHLISFLKKSLYHIGLMISIAASISHMYMTDAVR